MPKGIPGSGKAKKKFYKARVSSIFPKFSSAIQSKPLSEVKMSDLPTLIGAGAIVIFTS